MFPGYRERRILETIETIELIETLTYTKCWRHSITLSDRVIFHGQRLAKDAQINRDIVGILFFLFHHFFFFLLLFPLALTSCQLGSLSPLSFLVDASLPFRESSQFNRIDHSISRKYNIIWQL